MKRKLLALLLSAVCLTAMTSTAVAAEPEAQESFELLDQMTLAEYEEEDVPEDGATISIEESFEAGQDVQEDETLPTQELLEADVQEDLELIPDQEVDVQLDILPQDEEDADIIEDEIIDLEEGEDDLESEIEQADAAHNKHSYKDQKVTKKATPTNNGSKTQVCSCGETRKVTIYSPSGSIDLKNNTYTGKTLKPALTVYDKKGKVINASNYSISYSPKTVKAVGAYTATIKFKGKEYTGSFKIAISVQPKGTTITKLEDTKSGIKVTLKKQTSQTSGYELQWSANADLSKAKTKTLKTSQTSYTIPSLKKGTTYYVAVRTYKTVSGKKVYSSYSELKNLKYTGGTAPQGNEIVKFYGFSNNTLIDIGGYDFEKELPLYSVASTRKEFYSTYINKDDIAKAITTKYPKVYAQDSAGKNFEVSFEGWKVEEDTKNPGNYTAIAPVTLLDGYIMKKGVKAELSFPVSVSVSHTAGLAKPTEAEAAKLIKSVMSKEGFKQDDPWTDETKFYVSSGMLNGNIVLSGTGCAAFTLCISDAIFGNAPIVKVDNTKISEIKVGDIVRQSVDGVPDKHEGIVYERTGNIIKIAEGNIGSKVNYTRTIDLGNQISGQEINYFYTRW